MKLWLITLGMCIFSLGAMGGENTLLSCVKRNIKHYAMTSEQVETLAELMMNQDLEECRQLREGLQRLPRKSDNKVVVKNANLETKVRDLFLAFISPDYVCRGVTAAVGVSVFFGLDVSAQLLQCHGTDGANFILTVPKVAMAGWFGVCATVGIVTEYSYSAEDTYEEFNPGVDFCYGVGGVVRFNDTHDSYSVGLGGGLFVTSNSPPYYIAPRIKLAPLPPTYRKIKKNLGWIE